MTNMAKQEPTSFTAISSISTTPCTQTQQTLPHFYKPVLSQPRVHVNGGRQLKLVHNNSYKVTSQTQTIDSSSRENAIFSHDSMEHEVFSSNELEEDDSNEDNKVASGCCLGAFPLTCCATPRKHCPHAAHAPHPTLSCHFLQNHATKSCAQQ